MTNNNAVCSRVLQGVFLAVLLAVFGLAACGSGGGSTTTTNTSPTTLPAPGGIVLSLVPARTSGVAPLAVFFDASGTTDTGVTTRPFHDLEYTWSFGDPSSGTWASGAQPGVSSKNSATGPVAAHVFETPGAYTVTLTAFDGANSVTTNTTITVHDPDAVFAGTNTICVGATVLPTAGAGGCPAGASTAQQPDFATAINTYALTGRRVLFKRGDTFTAPTTGSLTRTGPGIVGAFGTGAVPKVQTTNYNTTILIVSSQSTPDISDWRVMDMEIDGSLVPDAGAAYCTISPPADPSLCNNVIGVGAGGAMKQTTFLRLSIHDTRNGFQLGDFMLDWWNNNGNPGHVMHDQVAIADSSVLHSIGGGGVGVAFSGNRLSMLGNVVDDTMRTEHVVRIFYLNKGVISNNTLSRQAPTKAVIKMHGPTWCAPGSPIGTGGKCTTTSSDYLTAVPPYGVGASGYTELVVVSDNKLVAADGTGWTFTIRPQNAISDERIRNVIVERNWFVAGNTSSSALVINAAEITARNNICDASQGNSHKCFLVGTNTNVEPPATDVRIYNNTFYSASAGDFIGVDIRAPATNTAVYNNLGSSPLAAAPTMVVNAGTLTVQGSNLFDTPSALFVSATPAVPADLILKSLPNPARDVGTAVPVWSDFFRTRRPQNGVIDIGAVEGP